MYTLLLVVNKTSSSLQIREKSNFCYTKSPDSVNDKLRFRSVVGIEDRLGFDIPFLSGAPAPYRLSQFN